MTPSSRNTPIPLDAIGSSEIPSESKQNGCYQTNKIHQLENSLVPPIQFKGQPSIRYNLLERMQYYNVPGVSIALIDKGGIAWTKSWGVKNINTEEPATTKTIFQAASISKLVSALAALRLVEAGKLSLDKPINNYLNRWQLPSNDLTEEVPVTLTHLLSHTGGLTVHGFSGYAPSDAQPTIIDVLNGAAISKSAPVVVDTLPGSLFRYSGGGSTVFQVAMEDATQTNFTQLIDKLVLEPIGMSRSTFAQPLPEAFRTDVACGHLKKGEVVSGGWHNYPTQSAASLWTTPSDLANFLIAVINAFNTKAGSSTKNNILSKPLCDKYLTEQISGWGLGPRLYLDEGKTIGFHHDGGNHGYRCNSAAFLVGQGAVIMTNSNTGNELISEIMSAAADVYDWPAQKPKIIDWLPLTPAEQTNLVGRYEQLNNGEIHEVNVELNGDGFKISSPWFAKPTTYYLTERKDNIITFVSGIGIPLDFSVDKEGYPFVKLMGSFFSRLIRLDQYSYNKFINSPHAEVG